jgi:hypothetical protein
VEFGDRDPARTYFSVQKMIATTASTSDATTIIARAIEPSPFKRSVVDQRVRAAGDDRVVRELRDKVRTACSGSTPISAA